MSATVTPEESVTTATMMTATEYVSDGVSNTSMMHGGVMHGGMMHGGMMHGGMMHRGTVVRGGNVVAAMGRGHVDAWNSVAWGGIHGRCLHGVAWRRLLVVAWGRRHHLALRCIALGRHTTWIVRLLHLTLRSLIY